MKLQMAYVGWDEVQQAQAKDLSYYWGVSLELEPTLEKLTFAHHDGLIVSLDGLSHSDQSQWARKLVAMQCDCPVAVHGYDINDNLATFLSDHDVHIFDKLDGQVFASLLRSHVTAMAG